MDIFFNSNSHIYIVAVKDMRMVDPEGVVEPVVAIVLLQHLVVSYLKVADVLLINAVIPDVIQDGHLLKI